MAQVLESQVVGVKPVAVREGVEKPAEEGVKVEAGMPPEEGGDGGGGDGGGGDGTGGGGEGGGGEGGGGDGTGGGGEGGGGEATGGGGDGTAPGLGLGNAGRLLPATAYTGFTYSFTLVMVYGPWLVTNAAPNTELGRVLRAPDNWSA